MTRLIRRDKAKEMPVTLTPPPGVNVPHILKSRHIDRNSRWKIKTKTNQKNTDTVDLRLSILQRRYPNVHPDPASLPHGQLTVYAAEQWTHIRVKQTFSNAVPTRMRDAWLQAISMAYQQVVLPEPGTSGNASTCRL
ncbi:MAG: hypothetical protein ACLFVO_05845 [Chloroflexaceae bacterium]